MKATKMVRFENTDRNWTADVIVSGGRTQATVVDTLTGEVIDVSSRRLDTIHNAIEHTLWHARHGTTPTKRF